MFIFSQFIVAAFAVIIAAKYFHRTFVWWEYLLQVIAVIGLSLVIYFGWKAAKNTDVEYWTDLMISVHYEERHEYWDPCARTYKCNCTTDSDGYRSCSTCCEGDCVTKSAHYWAVSKHGWKSAITKSFYLKLKGEWSNTQSTNRSNSCDRWKVHHSKWPGNFDSHYSFSEWHTYVNKIRWDQSVYKVFPLSKHEKKYLKSKQLIYDYPDVDINNQQSHIIGQWYDYVDLKKAQKHLSYFNAVQGPKSRSKNGQIKLFIFLYKDIPEKVWTTENRTRSEYVWRLQQSYWNHVNKNELVILLGYDSTTKEITWHKVLTWSLKPQLQTRTRNWIVDNKEPSLYQLSKATSGIASKHWLRREFTYLNSIVNQTPPGWLWVVTLLANVVLSVILIIVFKENEVYL